MPQKSFNSKTKSKLFQKFLLKVLSMENITVILTNADVRLPIQDQATPMLHGNEIEIPEQACFRWIGHGKFLFED